jgi:hypothetical protein
MADPYHGERCRARPGWRHSLGRDRDPPARYDLACNRCDRRSRLRIAQLVAEHGPDLPVRVQFNRADN